MINRLGPFRPTGKPIVNITLNNKKVVDWQSFRLELNGLGAVDSYQVDLPWEVTDNPRDPLLYSGPSQSADLVLGSANIQIEAGFQGEGDPQLLIEGPMDYPAWDFDEGENVSIHGRSYASAPFDYKETAKWQNLTSTAAFKQIAQFHGLNPIIPIETSTLTGEYENDDHVNMKREVSHWDFVLFLAQNEGFTTRVKGKDWYFGPRERLPNYNLDPLAFTWGFNIDKPFHIERAPNAARNLIVEVLSWIPGTKKRKGQRIVEKTSFVGSSDGQKYIMRYYYPNITRDEAQRRARNKLQELSRMQLFGSFPTDWSPDLSYDRKIALYGVGQGLSQTYFVPKIVITGSKSDGIRAEVSFTNLPLEEGGKFG
jgi:phage protein D